jgi:preprotein translocase subunit SecE
MAKAIAVQEQPTTGLDQLKTAPARFGEFLKDVRSEMKKVWTPSKEDVQSTTIVVLITVFMFAAYFALVDFTVGHAVAALFRYTGK